MSSLRRKAAGKRAQLRPSAMKPMLTMTGFFDLGIRVAFETCGGWRLYIKGRRGPVDMFLRGGAWAIPAFQTYYHDHDACLEQPAPVA